MSHTITQTRAMVRRENGLSNIHWPNHPKCETAHSIDLPLRYSFKMSSTVGSPIMPNSHFQFLCKISVGFVFTRTPPIASGPPENLREDPPYLEGNEL